LLIVWDRLPAHRSRLVREFLDSLGGQMVIEYLPPYAPELNPVEYLWGHWKQHTLPNVCPKDLWQLSDGPRRTLPPTPPPPPSDHCLLAAILFGLRLSYIMRNSVRTKICNRTTGPGISPERCRKLNLAPQKL